jgi:hypothetical protein
MSAWPATAERMPLVLAATRDGVVEGQRAVEQAALDLAAVGHLAQGGIEGGADLDVDRFDRRQDGHLGLGHAHHDRQLDGVLDDVHLVFEVGSMLIAASVISSGCG